VLRNLRHRAEYALAVCVGAVFRVLPIDFAASLAGSLVVWVTPWTAYHRRALRNLAVAFPDRSEAERRRIAAAMWRHTGRTIAEVILLDRIMTDPSRLEIEGREAWESRLREPGGKVAVTLHIGNWEMTGIAFATCSDKLAVTYRPLRNPYLDRYLRAARSPYYPSGLIAKVGRSGVRATPLALKAVIKGLREGGQLGLVCDQVDEGSPFAVSFFGQQAKFTSSPAVFVRAAGAQFWIARCLRRGRQSRFLIEHKELNVERTSDRDADLRNMTAAMALQFERWIRETPEQWMWWLRRSMVG
jgi:KDO2-lipid IV(A) lauroyltransferase